MDPTAIINKFFEIVELLARLEERISGVEKRAEEDRDEHGDRPARTQVTVAVIGLLMSAFSVLSSIALTLWLAFHQR
jgi:hypothetical protein